MINTPGIYQLSEAEYHADPCEQPSLSRSLAQKIIERSPLHAWYSHPRLNTSFKNKERSSYSDIGDAAHSMLLRGIDKRVVIDFDDYRKKEAQELRDKAYADGKIPILRDKVSQIDDMISALRCQLDRTDHARNAFKSDTSEGTVIAKDGDVWLRCMIDNYDDNFVYDYKTTSGYAEPEQWIKSNLFDGNHLQPVFYPRLLEMIDGKKRGFMFVVQEQVEPFAVFVVALQPQALSYAEEQVNEAIKIWSECTSQNKWPGYSEHTYWADLPPWLSTSWEMRKTIKADEKTTTSTYMAG